MKRVPTLVVASIVAAAWSSAALAKTPPKACEKRMKLLEQRLAAIPTHIGFGLSPLQVEPPTAEVGEIVMERGLIMDLKGTAFAFEGVIVEDGVKAFGDQADKIRSVEKMIGLEKAPAFLRIDRRTPLSDAIPFMCKVAEERAVHVVVRNPKTKYTPYDPPAPPPSVTDIVTTMMQRTEPAGRAELVTRAFMDAIKGCDALVSAVGAVNVAPPVERMRYLKRAVVSGARACGCDAVDVAAIEALIILMAAPISPPTVAFAPPLPCGQDKPYGLPKDAKFDELVKKIAP